MNIEKSKQIYYTTICVGIGFGVLGQLLLKLVALQTTGGAFVWSVIPGLIVALIIYSIGVLFWIFSLRHIRLSVAYSLSSLNYVGILFGSYYMFGEQIDAARISGVALIFTGVFLVVSRSGEKKPLEMQETLLRPELVPLQEEKVQI
ncbi:MAG: small multidrug resistance protein [Pseudomonadota bacterium]